jgi:mono/diheme cytochrome c family protein
MIVIVRRTLIALLSGLILLAVGLPLAAYSGVYNVAASVPHRAATEWLLDTAMVHSVRRRAKPMEMPDLSDPARIQRGAGHYAVLCISCHGAPGVEATDIGRGLNPAPPALEDVASEWSAEELYWIVSHGIKFTGMPGFGSTQDEEKLWDIVALVQRLPALSPEEYRELGMP